MVEQDEGYDDKEIEEKKVRQEFFGFLIDIEKNVHQFVWYDVNGFNHPDYDTVWKSNVEEIIKVVEFSCWDWDKGFTIFFQR